MAGRRGTQHLRRKRRGRATEPRSDPGPPTVSGLLEQSAERSRRRTRGWERHTWGDGTSTAWERRSAAAWVVRAFELGGVARQRLVRSIAVDLAVLAAILAVVVVVVVLT